MDRIRVGNFELLPSERLLCADGRPVELGARAFDLLLVLVENAGRLVSKATLLERVWPRLIVDENNLPAQVASLRRVLGAGAIRTVPRFGYRLDLEVAPASSTDPPPPPSRAAAGLSIPRHAWPRRLGPLFGRDDDLQLLETALDRAALVTLVGGAGVGKTRLAQEIHARRADRQGAAVAWIALEPIDDAALVPQAIALALGISLPAAAEPYLALRQALERLPLLLVMDGAEHVGEALAPALAALIAQTEGLRALVTSQTPLGVAGETIVRLSPLAVPESGAVATEVAHYASVALFARRAAEADRRFELNAGNATLVAEVCRRLDGNPLALELAAARVPAFGVAALLERLDDRFRLLKQSGRAADPRHGVLEAAFDWSYGLLTEPEQRVFDRLGVFAGSFTLAAAASCVADAEIGVADATDLIGRLADRSLVTVLPTEPPRYLLLETARCYAAARLRAGGGLEMARARFAATMLRLLDSAYEEYWSADEAVWLHQYLPELDNVREAMAWARTAEPPTAAALCGSAWPLLAETDWQAAGCGPLAADAATLAGALPPPRAARFWEAMATLHSGRRPDSACDAAARAAALCAANGNVRGEYYARMQTALNRGDAPGRAADIAAAQRLEDPAMPPRLLVHGAMAEGAALAARGELDGARAAYRRALGTALAMSERQALAATVKIVELDVAAGDLAAALQLARPLALSLRHSGRRETHLEILGLLFSALLLGGEMTEARATGAELYDLALRLDAASLLGALDAMALFAARDGRCEQAARIAGTADAAHAGDGRPGRGPAAARVRAEVARLLDGQDPAGRRDEPQDSARPLPERAACALALGLA